MDEVAPAVVPHLINLVAANEQLPTQWSHGRITVLPKVKSGKEDLRDPRKYRPITVTSCLLRVFEGVFINRLKRAMSRKLSEVQGGFVEERGTAEQLFAIREVCWRSRREKKPLVLAFLDLRKAFDTVWHDGLLFKLWVRFNVRGKLWRVTKLLLDNNFVDRECQNRVHKIECWNTSRW